MAAKHDVGHVINNAYGIMSRTCMGSIARAAAAGRVDAVVQSTDKNFQVPVGGAIIATAKAPKPKKVKESPRGPPGEGGVPERPAARPDICVEVSKVYPGRASGAPLLDLFITLLSMGCDGFKEALETRVECMEYMRERLTELACVLRTVYLNLFLGWTFADTYRRCACGS